MLVGSAGPPSTVELSDGAGLPAIWTEHPARATTDTTASAANGSFLAFTLSILPRGGRGSRDARVEP
ncbi:hypothetical protein GCM10009648_37080 [Tsukamurella spumae]